MTAVLLLGEVPSTGYVGGVAAERVILGPEAPAVPASRFIALAGERLARHQAIVALYPAWHTASAERFIRLARGVLNTDRIAGLGVNLPPLALSLIADQLAYLASYVSPGVLASLATRLPREIMAGAWLRSVAGLAHIDTSMGDHVKSYLPGGFMVSAAPRHGVHRITGGAPVPDLGRRPADPIQVLATRCEGDLGWFQQKLMGEVRPAVVTFTQPQSLSAEFWGAKKYLEYVAFSGHPEALSHLVATTECEPCPWCAEPVGVRICPFCRMTQEPPAPAEPRVTSYGTPVPTEPEHTPPAPDQDLQQTARPEHTPGPPSGQPNRPDHDSGRPPEHHPSPSGPRPRPPTTGHGGPDIRVATSGHQEHLPDSGPQDGSVRRSEQESDHRSPASTPATSVRRPPSEPESTAASDPRNGVL